MINEPKFGEEERGSEEIDTPFSGYGGGKAEVMKRSMFKKEDKRDAGAGYLAEL